MASTHQKFQVDIYLIDLPKKIHIDDNYHLYLIAQELLRVKKATLISEIAFLRNIEIQRGNSVLFSQALEVSVFNRNEKLEYEESHLLSLLCAEKFIKKYEEKIKEFLMLAILPVIKNKESVEHLINNRVSENDERYKEAMTSLETSVNVYKRYDIDEYQNALANLQRDIANQIKVVESLRSKILTNALIKKHTHTNKLREKASSPPTLPHLNVSPSFWKKEKKEESAPQKSKSAATSPTLPTIVSKPRSQSR